MQLGDEPADTDISLGYIRHAHWAKALCEAANAAGGVVPGRSFNVDTEWDRSEELRTDRLGPSQDDVKVDDPDRPVKRLR